MKCTDENIHAITYVIVLEKFITSFDIEVGKQNT